MKNAVTNSCGKNRGCWVVITLPYDRRPGSVLSKMYGVGHDLQKVLPMAHAYLDTKLEKEEPLAKMAA